MPEIDIAAEITLLYLSHDERQALCEGRQPVLEPELLVPRSVEFTTFHRPHTQSLQMNSGSLLTRINCELNVTCLPVLISHEHALENDRVADAGEAKNDGSNLMKAKVSSVPN